MLGEQSQKGPDFRALSRVQDPRAKNQLSDSRKLQAALALLDARPSVPVLLVDLPRAPGVRTTIEAEVPTPARDHILINRRGRIWRRGTVTRLAALLVHETEHVAGGDEVAARRAELRWLEAHGTKHDRSEVARLRRDLESLNAIKAGRPIPQRR